MIKLTFRDINVGSQIFYIPNNMCFQFSDKVHNDLLYQIKNQLIVTYCAQYQYKLLFIHSLCLFTVVDIINDVRSYKNI